MGLAGALGGSGSWEVVGEFWGDCRRVGRERQGVWGGEDVGRSFDSGSETPEFDIFLTNCQVQFSQNAGV